METAISSRESSVPGVLPLISEAKRDLEDEGTTGWLDVSLVAPLSLVNGISVAAARALAAARKARFCITERGPDVVLWVGPWTPVTQGMPRSWTTSGALPLAVHA